MDEDDLPPRPGHRTDSLGAALGQVAGAVVPIAIIVAIVGAVIYFARVWTN